MFNQERKLDELKKAVPGEKGDAFDVEIPDKELETASGGAAALQSDVCACLCGQGTGCSGGGGG
jgi:hypothetical protein